MIDALPRSLHDDAIALWETCGLTRPWNDPRSDLERAVSGSGSTVLAAVVDGQLLGTAMVGTDGHRAWMYYLAVDPAERGTGLGRELVRACEAWAREHDVPKLMLMVRSTNEQVLGFYEALGYEVNDVATLGKFL